MSLTKAQFKETAKSIGAVLLATTFMAANANAAPTEELTCYTKEADIKAAQTRLLQNENMIPVTSHFKNVGTDQSPQWAMSTLMYNQTTKKGYEWSKMPQGHVCLSKSYSNIQLYPNLNLDPKSFMDTKSAANADDTGNGKDYTTIGANAALLINEKKHQFPMYRANVDDIINISKAPIKTPTKYVEYLVGNPNTKEGTVLAANFNGKMISEYMNVVGTPQANGVKFGAIYSPAGEDLVGLKPSLAVAVLDRK